MVAGSDTYKTRDGFICIGANWQPQFEGLCRVLGEEWLLTDPRFIDDDARMKNTVALRAELQRAFSEKSAAELEGKLAAAKVPAGKVRNLLETIAHPHVAEREFFNNVDVPGLDSPATLAGAGFRFAHDGPVRENAVPSLGEHTDAVLAELGFTDAEIEHLRISGAV